MAVDNPTAVKFSNERIRRAADKLVQAYNFAKIIQGEWFNVEMSAGVTLSSGIPNDGAEIVIDGSAIDGRSQIAGDDINNVMNRLAELVADYETGGVLATLQKVAVNVDINVSELP